jgi:hypothetical protein
MFLSRFDSEGYGRVIFLSLTAAFLVLTLSRYPFLPVFYEGDHVIQMFDAVRMLQGEALYKDFFQFTFPGTDLWYLFLFKIFGERIWLLNATIFLLGFGIAWAMLEVSFRVMKGWFAYLAPSTFIFLGFRWLAIDGSHRLFSLFFALLAIYVLIKEINRWRLLAAGALAGMASFFTQTRGIAIAAGISLFLLWYYWPRKGISVAGSFATLSRALFVLGGSFAATLAILLGYFILTCPGPFFESTLLFGKNYLADPANQWGDSLKFLTSPGLGEFNRIVIANVFYQLVIVAALISFPLYYFKNRKNFDIPVWQGPALLFCTGLIVVLSSPGSIRLIHSAIVYSAIIMLILLAWIAEHFLRDRLGGDTGTSRPEWVAVSLTMGAIVVGLSGAVWSYLKGYQSRVELRVGPAVFLSAEVGERYQWAGEHTIPDEYVYEAYRPGVNFSMQLRNPTRIPILRPSNYTSKEQIAGIVQDLLLHRPRYILWDGSWSKPANERADGDNIAPLYQFLLENYRLRQELTPVYEGPTQIWEISN